MCQSYICIKLLVLVLLVTLYDSANGGPTCLSCKDVPVPTDCTNIVHCHAHEKCYLEQYVTDDGVILYEMGCRDSMMCHNKRSIANISSNSNQKRVIKHEISNAKTAPVAANQRSVNKHEANQRSVNKIVVCDECCGTDLCSAGMCNTKGFLTLSSNTRGPICYDCDDRLHPGDCETINTCGRDQICLVHKSSDRYHSSCSYAAQCSAIVSLSQHVSGDTCVPKCCSTDLCNGNCSPVNSTTDSSTSPIHSTPTPSIQYTTVSGCHDNPAIQCKPLVCIVPSLAKLCPVTCGLCAAFTPICDGSAEFIRHPEDCAKWYLCSRGIAHAHECAPTHVFNLDIHRCDDLSRVPSCQK